jgi:cytochrome c peroxidase
VKRLVFLAGLCGCAGGDVTEEERALLARLTLQPLPPDPTNAVADDARAATLGQELFFDSRYAGPLAIGDDGANGALGAAGETGKVACASCHDPAQGGTDRHSRGATSLGAGWTGRNAPTVVNAARSRTPWMFWDGRKDSLWAQALGPPEGAVEINSSRVAVVRHLAAHYRAPYEELFGALPDVSLLPATGKPGDAAFDALSDDLKNAVNAAYANFGKAIAAYERKLLDPSSPFDRWMQGRGTLSDSAVRGARLFVGRGACNECHDGPLLADGKFHNHGVPQSGPEVPSSDRGRAAGIPQVLADPFNAAGDFSDDRAAKHLQGLLATDLDVGAFKTPTLRNCSRTAPYMHTGGFDTLWAVLVFYRDNAGSDQHVGERDPGDQPLRLSDDDLNDLAAFLLTLDGDALDPALTTAPVLP